MDPHEIDQLRSDNQRLRMLVEEARESRDAAETKAKEACQREMAALRAENARLLDELRAAMFPRTQP